MKEQILAVQRMQDYIEEHLYEDISLANLSEVSFFSPWHSYRLFRKYVKLTPTDYIRRLRLSRSAMRLKRGDCVAYDFGFGSIDGYTRAFYKEFGHNPSNYAKEPVPITLFIPYSVKFRELTERRYDMENLQSVFVQIIHKGKHKVIIKRGVKAEDYMSYCKEVGCDVWGMLMSMDSLCGEPICLWLNESYKKPNTSIYVQGVEVDISYNGIVPEGFDEIILPAGEYLAFQGEPFNEENYEQAISSVQQAMNKYDPSIIGYEWNDDLPRIQLEPRGERGYIELRSVRLKKSK